MSWQSQLEIITRIRDECIGEKFESKDIYKFSYKKCIINKKLRKIREFIKERDKYDKNQKINDVLRYSSNIRICINDVFNDAESLIKIQERDIKFNKNNKNMKQLLNNRDTIIKLIFTHIRECELLESKKCENYELEKLVKLPDINTIPDLEIEEEQYKNMYIDELINNILNGSIDITGY